MCWSIIRGIHIDVNVRYRRNLTYTQIRLTIDPIRLKCFEMLIIYFIISISVRVVKRCLREYSTLWVPLSILRIDSSWNNTRIESYTVCRILLSQSSHATYNLSPAQFDAHRGICDAEQSHIPTHVRVNDHSPELMDTFTESPGRSIYGALKPTEWQNNDANNGVSVKTLLISLMHDGWYTLVERISARSWLITRLIANNNRTTQ